MTAHDPADASTSHYSTSAALLTAWRDAHGDYALGADVAELADAIAHERLYVAYQPIVRLSDGQVTAVEALVRYDDPVHQALKSPFDLIVTAERHGLIHAVGRYVMERACAQVAAWRNDVPSLQVHVNVSPIELRESTFIAEVIALLDDVGLPPQALVVEVTESAALDRESDAKHVLIGLASVGITIALDDFGTGFASLDVLADTPASIVKLDRSFVAALGDTDSAQRNRALIMQAAIGMARSLGLELVGEGVEEVTQARTLLSWGCDYGQGFLYGRPKRAESFDADTLRVLPGPAQFLLGDDELSAEAVDLGMSLAGVFATLDEDRGELRAAAVSAASVIAAALGASRARADTAGLLATLVDLDAKLTQFGANLDELRPALAEIRDRLAITPIIGRNTSAGAISRTAWALAQARARGDAAPDPALLAAHPDPEIDRQLRARVDDWWHGSERVLSVRSTLLALEDRIRSRGDVNARLRALVGLARAIGSDGDLVDVLAVTAQEALDVIGAASLSIVQIDHDTTTFHVLVNVGDLADWEEARPTDEHYTVDDLPVSTNQLLNRSMHFEVLGDPEGHPAEQELLRRIGKDSAAYVPLFVDGEVWGALFSSTATGTPMFTLADGPFLSAVASFVSVAISRSEHVAALRREVQRDPLTGLVNRRYLADTTGGMLVAHPSAPVSLAVVQVRDLDVINDTAGFTAGDDEIKGVAATLDARFHAHSTNVVGRLSGAHFYVLGHTSARELRRQLEAACAQLANTRSPVNVHAGIVECVSQIAVADAINQANAACVHAYDAHIPVHVVAADV